MSAKVLLLFMRLLAPLPLSVVRALGAVLGGVLYYLARPRRRVVQRNLSACFPQLSAAERQRQCRLVFRYFAQSWLDRAWLWHASPATLARRLHWHGDTQVLQGDKPVLIFAPHFMGLDAGGMALGLANWRPTASIYARQLNPLLDDWVRQGRSRFHNTILVDRKHSLRGVVQALRRDNANFYLLPDMDLGREDAVFVPFFGLSTATVPTLPRLARMGQVAVVSMVSVLSPRGYEMHLSPIWPNYPSADASTDTARMNAELEALIEQHGIAQYYWVHKRFKTRPLADEKFYD